MGCAANDPAGVRHEAVAYSSPGELVLCLAPRIRVALRAGERVTAVLAAGAAEGLRAALGRSADAVTFLDPRRVHTVPGFTTAVRWARRAVRAGEAGEPQLIIGQQLLDLPGCGPGYWARLCLGLEVAGVGLRLTVLCPFADDAAGWARIGPLHRTLSGTGGPARNPAYRPPREVIRAHPLPPPAELGPPAAELAFRATDLGAVRQLTAELAERGGLAPERADDAVLAVNELATNSIEHGPGHGRLRLWLWLWTGVDGLLAEVADGGRLAEPFPGLARPPTGSHRGRGLWLASELSDVMEVWPDGGTVVRLSWRRS